MFREIRQANVTISQLLHLQPTITDMLPQGVGAPFAFKDSPTRAILTTFRSYHVTSTIHEPREFQPKVAFHFLTYRHS